MDTVKHTPGDPTGILREQSRLGRIQKYIGENLSTDLSAAVVSEKFELSVSSLLHILKKHEQQSYRRYVEEARMNRAFDLIIRESKRVKEAMNATGYKNRITFYNAFKRTFKYSPRHFRR